MPQFTYTAIDAEGNMKRGNTLAANHSSAILWVQQQGLVPVNAQELLHQSAGAPREIPEKPRKESNKKLGYTRAIGDKERILFVKSLLTMLQAGLALDKSLRLLESREANAVLRAGQATMLQAISNGDTFSEAAAKTGLFEDVHLAQFRAGEASGRLNDTLAIVEQYLKRSDAIDKQLKAALMYPLVLCALTILSLGLIFSLVVPKIADLFVDAPTLPLSTEVVIGISTLLNAYGWWLIAGLLLLGVSAYSCLQTRHLQTYILRVPMLGELFVYIESARFCRCLASLLGAGMPLLKSLDYSFSAIKNQLMRERLEVATSAVKSGDRLADALESTQVLPTLSVQLIAVGENSGALPAMLHRVADVLDDDVETRLQRLLSLIEPVLVIGLGVIIGGIILSILSAIVSVNELSF